MAFRKGAEQAQAAQKTGGGNFQKAEYFSISDKEKAILRFLTDADDWITVDQHAMVPTKPKPEGYSGNWPDKMGAVCRRDPAFEGEFPDCYICDYLVDGKNVKKPAARQWALACLREEVREGGKIVGFKDKERTVTRKNDKDEDVETIEKAIVVVNMGYKNFFAALQGQAEYRGTILDRDYLVTRSGNGTATTYSLIGLDPIQVDGKTFDLRDPEFAKRYETDLDLEKVIREKAEDKFYARFFDPRVTVNEGGNVSDTGAEAPPKPDNDVSEQDKLDELASRLQSYSGASAEPAAAGAGGMKDFS